MMLGAKRAVALGARNGHRVRYMATEKELKKRLTSVASIQKITKASKMVAAAKMRGVQNMLMIGRPFARPLTNIWKTAEEIEEEEAKYKKAKDDADTDDYSLEGNALIVPITTDRGLCGGVNSFVVKKFRKAFAECGTDEIAVLPMGERGRSSMARGFGKKFNLAIVDASKSVIPSFELALSVANVYLEQQFDSSMFIWNRFSSAISYATVITKIPSFEKRLERLEPFALYEFEGDENETLQNLSEYTAATEMYRFFLENNTTEQAQKMTAMENSTKNAGELIEKLQIQYNRSRQARITTELIEIISGASALE